VKASVAVAVSTASLVYASSLVLQRAFPSLGEALGWSLAGGIAPTYYLRVALGLVAALVAAQLTPRRPVSEAWLAWGTGAALAASTILICAFP
jgi:hypothetical protein